MIEALLSIAFVAAIAVAVIHFRAWDAVNQPGEERTALQAVVDALTKQHQWHAAQTDPDPEHGFIPAVEYEDSALYDATVEALSVANRVLTGGNVDLAGSCDRGEG